MAAEMRRLVVRKPSYEREWISVHWSLFTSWVASARRETRGELVGLGGLTFEMYVSTIFAMKTYTISSLSTLFR